MVLGFTTWAGVTYEAGVKGRRDRAVRAGGEEGETGSERQGGGVGCVKAVNGKVGG